MLKAAQGPQIEHYFVEQDECDKAPIESLRMSYHYLEPLFTNIA